ncbi:hypothetical protein NEOLEDRAFT_1139101 [Neolentinus lepideus HHB14362 ss-1]|uniref:Uncharacterized protein n=1 Tax=Neolentinus lepideus HHB14362 ss-1 TaxID=1314782 RepID=A0A165PZ70_9AGAM|nr:hypothetical protein NEOLEDRAFT_1139101 [Neolentinus lepideus HHB14362 ss-1]
MNAQQEYPSQYLSLTVRRLYARDNGSGSNTTIIIAVVCGVVGGIILVFMLWQVVWKLCRPKRNPLPPVQPLVHHRHAHIASLADRDSSRPATWFDTGHLSVRHGSFPSGSDISLITSSPGKSPSRQTSFHTEETMSRRISDDTSMHLSAATAEDLSLTPPNPAFARDSSRDSSSPVGPSVSTSSLGSFDAPFPPPLSISPHSSASVLSDARSQSVERRPRANHIRSLSRPVSLASSISTAHTNRSRSTIRGPPHARHSNIQIVLPAPLAPSMYREETDSEVNVFLNSPIHLRSATDSWIGVGNQRSVSQERPSVRHHQWTTSESSRSSKRSQRPDASSYQPSARPPPVPRLPSEYSEQYSYSPTTISPESHQYPPLENVNRGRQQRASSQSSAHAPNKLQKQKQRSRSRSKGAVLRQSSYEHHAQGPPAEAYYAQPQDV